MATSERLTCVISGSFSKFKPEIDSLHSEFGDNDIDVLAPDKGWVAADYVRSKVIFPSGFRALPSERGMSPKEIEEQFLRCLGRAHFLYLHNQDGYLGNSAYFELGNAMAAQKPVYARQELEYDPDFEDLREWLAVKKYVRVVPIPQISEDFYQSTATASWQRQEHPPSWHRLF